MPRPYSQGPADVYDAKYNQGAKLIPHKCPYECFEKVQAVHKKVAQLEAQINVLFSCLKEYFKEDDSAPPLPSTLPPRLTLPITNPILPVLKRTVVLTKRSADSSHFTPCIFSMVKDEVPEEPAEKKIRTDSVEDRAPVLDDEGTSALDLMNDDDEEEDFEYNLAAPKLDETDECGTSALSLMDEEEEEAPRLEMAGTPPPTLEKVEGEGEEDLNKEEEEKAEFDNAGYITDRDVKKALMKTKWMTKGEPAEKDGKFYNPSDKKKILTEQQLNLFCERAILLTDDRSELISTKPYITQKMVKDCTNRLCKLGLLIKCGLNVLRKQKVHDSKEFQLGLAHRAISAEDYLNTLA